MLSRAQRIAAMFSVKDGVTTVGDPDEDPWESEQRVKAEQRKAKREQSTKSKTKRAALAAQKLEKAGAGLLDVHLLLDELTVDARIQWLSFLLTDGENGRYFNFERMQLRRIGIERRRNGRMKDLRAWIDTEGIHLRWGDRGGLDLRGQGGRVTDTRALRMTFLTKQTVETAA